MRHHHPGRLMLTAVSTVFAIAGCGDGEDPPVPAPDAAAYATAITPFLPTGNTDDPPNVFVAPFDEPLSLEEQVAIIDTIGDGYDLTFVDEAEAAVDSEADGLPVHDAGLLMVLGTIASDPPHVVRIETYRSEDDHAASLVTLVWRSDHWEVAAEDPVDPEAVILDD